MNIAIIGCGLIGEKRARVLREHKLIITSDTNIDRARKVSQFGEEVIITTDWREAAGHPEVDIVIVSTTNNWLTAISLYALEHEKHVIVEKPAALTHKELEPLLKKSGESKCKIKVGFNHRYHPALMKAREIFNSEEPGELMFIRGRYGQGGRVGYEKEWRANPKISGGGELIDQGVHLIDLSRWFLGNFSRVEGFVETYFWNMTVEDNAFLSLRTQQGQTAWLHVSCSEWKNMFCLEIYGKYGKLQIDGLGGSYGVERLTYYKMLPEMGPPETTIWEYPGEDKSWKYEFEDFINSICNNKPVCGDIEDAYEALKIVDKIYGGRYDNRS